MRLLIIMDIKIEKKKYLVPKKYWPWIGGGTVIVAVLVWLPTGNFASTLKVERRGLSIGGAYTSGAGVARRGRHSA